MSPVLVIRDRRRPYGCMSFIFDLLMIGVTTILLGFPWWILWIIIREVRGR